MVFFFFFLKVLGLISAVNVQIPFLHLSVYDFACHTGVFDGGSMRNWEVEILYVLFFLLSDFQMNIY